MVFPDPGIASRLLPAALAGFVTELLPREGRRGADRARRSSPCRRPIRSRPAPAARSRPTSSSPGSGSSRTPSSRRRPGSPSTTGSSSTSSAASAGSADVFAAGDVANFPVAALGRRLRVEHEDHANTHGKRRRREHGGRGHAVRPPAVLLLRPVRARLRGGRRGRSSPGHHGTVGRAEPQGRSSPTSTRAAGLAGSCSGTCGTRSTADGELIRAAERLDPVLDV